MRIIRSYLMVLFLVFCLSSMASGQLYCCWDYPTFTEAYQTAQTIYGQLLGQGYPKANLWIEVRSDHNVYVCYSSVPGGPAVTIWECRQTDCGHGNFTRNYNGQKWISNLIDYKSVVDVTKTPIPSGQFECNSILVNAVNCGDGIGWQAQWFDPLTGDVFCTGTGQCSAGNCPYITTSDFSTPPCVSGQHWDSTTQTCIDNCPQGQHWNGTTCITCAIGQHWDSTAKACVSDSCPQGMHWDSVQGKCVADGCIQGQHWDATLQKCVDNPHNCADGQHWDSVQGKCVDDTPPPHDCPDGFHWDFVIAQCVPNESGQIGTGTDFIGTGTGRIGTGTDYSDGSYFIRSHIDNIQYTDSIPDEGQDKKTDDSWLTTLFGLFTNHPLIAIIKNSKITTSGEVCSLSVNLYGKTIEISFCNLAEYLDYFGYFVFVVASIQSYFIMFRK